MAVLVGLALSPPRLVVDHGTHYLATEADSRGFFGPETDGTGHRFVWTEPRAVTAFAFAGRQPLALHLMLRSAAVAGGSARLPVLMGGIDIALVLAAINVGLFALLMAASGPATVVHGSGPNASRCRALVGVPRDAGVPKRLSWPGVQRARRDRAMPPVTGRSMASRGPPCSREDASSIGQA